MPRKVKRGVREGRHVAAAAARRTWVRKWEEGGRGVTGGVALHARKARGTWSASWDICLARLLILKNRKRGQAWDSASAYFQQTWEELVGHLKNTRNVWRKPSAHKI